MHKSFEIKASWCRKEGGMIKTVKKRWFILFEDSLKYFADEDQEQEKGQIPFSVESTVDIDTTYKIQPCFFINCPERKRVYRIFPETEVDRDEWVAMISNLINLKRTSGNPKYITRFPRFFTFFITPSELLWKIRKEDIPEISVMLQDIVNKNAMSINQLGRMVAYICQNRLTKLRLYADLMGEFLSTQKNVDGAAILKDCPHLVALLIKRRKISGKQLEGFESKSEDQICDIFDQGSLMNAIFYDNLQAFQIYADKKEFDTNQEVDGKPLINIAAHYGAYKVFRFLFKTVRVDEVTLKEAAFGGNKEIYKLCKQKITTPREVIDAAISNHQTEMVSYLYSEEELDYTYISCLRSSNFRAFFDRFFKNADPNWKDPEECTPMMGAASAGFQSLLLLISECEGSIDSQGRDGYTPLCFAAQYDQIDCGNYLINNHTNLESNTARDGTPLVIAAKNCAWRFLKLLIEGKSNVNATDSLGNSALMYAIKNNNEEITQLLLESKANPNNLNKNRDTPIFYAVDSCNVNIVRMLLERRATVDLKNEKGDTPIHRACKHNNIIIVDYLIRCGAKLEELDHHNNTPLMIAMDNSNLDVMRLLIQRGANASNYDKDGSTPLMFCAKNNKLDAAKVICECGVNPEVMDYEGKTALMYACLFNNVDIIRYLASRRCNIEVIDKFGRTPVMLSLASKNFDAAYALAQAGCNLHAKDLGGGSILYYAAFYGDTRMAKFCIDNQKGVELDINIDNQTPLILAATQQNSQLVDILVGAGASPDVFNLRGITPMCIAAINNDFETIKSFVKNKVPIDGRDAKLNTPLMHACACNCIEIAKYLVDCGAQIEAKNSIGATPLSFAVASNAKEIVSFLLFKRANANNVEGNGITPLMITVMNNNPQIAKLLIEFGADITKKNNDGNTALDLCYVHQSSEIEKMIKQKMERGF